jgi:hypothetical protein
LSKALSETVVSSNKTTILNIDFQCMTYGQDRKTGRGGWKEERGRGWGNCPSPSDLFFYNCFNRADLRATSTFGTFLFVNNVRLPFFNSFSGTFFCTGSTSHAFFGNDVSHRHHPL